MSYLKYIVNNYDAKSYNLNKYLYNKSLVRVNRQNRGKIFIMDNNDKYYAHRIEQPRPLPWFIQRKIKKPPVEEKPIPLPIGSSLNDKIYRFISKSYKRIQFSLSVPSFSINSKKFLLSYSKALSSISKMKRLRRKKPKIFIVERLKGGFECFSNGLHGILPTAEYQEILSRRRKFLKYKKKKHLKAKKQLLKIIKRLKAEKLLKGKKLSKSKARKLLKAKKLLKGKKYPKKRKHLRGLPINNLKIRWTPGYLRKRFLKKFSYKGFSFFNKINYFYLDSQTEKISEIKTEELRKSIELKAKKRSKLDKLKAKRRKNLKPYDGTKTVVRTGTKTVVRTGTKTVVRTGTKTVVRTGTKTVVRTGTKTVVKRKRLTRAQRKLNRKRKRKRLKLQRKKLELEKSILKLKIEKAKGILKLLKKKSLDKKVNLRQNLSKAEQININKKRQQKLSQIRRLGKILFKDENSSKHYWSLIQKRYEKIKERKTPHQHGHIGKGNPRIYVRKVK